MILNRQHMMKFSRAWQRFERQQTDNSDDLTPQRAAREIDKLLGWVERHDMSTEKAKRRLYAALAREARALFRNLPDGEIREEEGLYFRVSPAGLTVHVTRTDYFYAYREGVTCRYKRRNDGSIDMAIFKDRQELEITEEIREREERAWAPWMI